MNVEEGTKFTPQQFIFPSFASFPLFNGSILKLLAGAEKFSVYNRDRGDAVTQSKVSEHRWNEEYIHTARGDVSECDRVRIFTLGEDVNETKQRESEPQQREKWMCPWHEVLEHKQRGHSCEKQVDMQSQGVPCP
jgi:hypothetical protein